MVLPVHRYGPEPTLHSSRVDACWWLRALCWDGGWEPEPHVAGSKPTALLAPLHLRTHASKIQKTQKGRTLIFPLGAEKYRKSDK